MTKAKTYKGKPCKRGHDGTRYTSGGECVECNKARRQTPERKAYNKAYQQTPEYKAYEKARQQTPEYKAYGKAYRLRVQEGVLKLLGW